MSVPGLTQPIVDFPDSGINDNEARRKLAPVPTESSSGNDSNNEGGIAQELHIGAGLNPNGLNRPPIYPVEQEDCKLKIVLHIVVLSI